MVRHREIDGGAAVEKRQIDVAGSVLEQPRVQSRRHELRRTEALKKIVSGDFESFSFLIHVQNAVLHVVDLECGGGAVFAAEFEGSVAAICRPAAAPEWEADSGELATVEWRFASIVRLIWNA